MGAFYFAERRLMIMGTRFADRLSEEQKQQLSRLRSKQKKPPNELTRKDWEEIMGKNRDTYRRVNGSIRRK